MLKTPPTIFQPCNDELARMLAAISTTTTDPVAMADGVVQVSHFSLDLLIWGHNHTSPKEYMIYPWLGKDFNCYGVCDSPKQFLDKFEKCLRDDKRVFCVSLTHVEKDPANAGHGGGWRWHKWGPYIGEGKPTTEYLDDEPDFDDGVWVYHVYQFNGPKIPAPWDRTEEA